MSRSWEFKFDWPRPPLSLNYRLHRMAEAKIVKDVRLAARLAVNRLPVMERIRVELFWFVNDKRRRDDENPVPTLKALCDGLVDAELVEDDTAEFMEKVMPRIVPRPKNDGVACMVLRITDIGETGE